MWRLALAVSVLSASWTQAQSATTAVLEATGVADAPVRRVQRAAEEALRRASAFAVAEGQPFKRGQPRACGASCEQALVRAADAAAVLVLSLEPGAAKDAVHVSATLWVDGERAAARRADVPQDGGDAAVGALVEALVPAWARKGFGGLSLALDGNAVVKVDGRVTPVRPGQPLPLPAGPHRVDVVFPGGGALLQRVDVAEGARTRLEAVLPEGASLTAGRPGTSALRTASFASWMAGSAAVAAGLVAGALARGTSAGMAPCSADTRSCPTLELAQERARQAEALAATGNVLLGVGGGLLAVGAGLFTVDVVAGR